MPHRPFDRANPSEEPPAHVVHVALWRLARSVWSEHAVPPDADPLPVRRCPACGDAWPCRSHRLAERVLARLIDPPRVRRVRNQAYLDWLRDRRDKGDTI